MQLNRKNKDLTYILYSLDVSLMEHNGIIIRTTR